MMTPQIRLFDIKKECNFIFFRCYQKKDSRVTAELGSQCVSELTGPNRDLHTNQLAESLVAEEVINLNNDEDESSGSDVPSSQNSELLISDDVFHIKDNETDISIPPNTRRDVSPNAAVASMISQETIHLKDDVCDILAPEVTIIADEDAQEVIGELASLLPVAEKNTDSLSEMTPITVDVEYDADVKKEELLDESKRISFTTEEDNYIKEGYQKYASSGTKWADILKDPDYTFHPSRKRDTLRVRYTSLKGGATSKQDGRRRLRNADSSKTSAKKIKKSR